MQKVRDYIYVCGGLANNIIFPDCERFSLIDKKWHKDVPNLQQAKFSMTMMVMDKTWLYSFGGLSDTHGMDTGFFQVERLNTDLIGQPDTQWQRIEIKTNYNIVCQQGIIPLNYSHSDVMIGKPGERRYLIFGGVKSTYTD
jgi:hypothetical protein